MLLLNADKRNILQLREKYKTKLNECIVHTHTVQIKRCSMVHINQWKKLEGTRWVQSHADDWLRHLAIDDESQWRI